MKRLPLPFRLAALAATVAIFSAVALLGQADPKNTAGKMQAAAGKFVRHAIETGTDPVPLIAALAAKLRTLVKVGAARGRGGVTPAELGLAPWQIDRARKDLVKWDANRLATAIEAVAQADAEVKGASRAPAFALERVVRTVAELAS